MQLWLVNVEVHVSQMNTILSVEFCSLSLFYLAFQLKSFENYSMHWIFCLDKILIVSAYVFIHCLNILESEHYFSSWLSELILHYRHVQYLFFSWVQKRIYSFLTPFLWEEITESYRVVWSRIYKVFTCLYNLLCCVIRWKSS